MSKELLIETHTIKVSPSQLTENVNRENGNLIVEGILATAEVKNGNGRYYKKELWDREMEKYDQLVKERRSMGELDHPESTVINLKNVSHIVTGYNWDGDQLMGKIEILPTPSGNILKELIKNGITVGVSSRGMGSLEQIGSAGDQSAAGILHLYSPSSTTYMKNFACHVAAMHTLGIILDCSTSGIVNSTSAINAIDFKMGSGNIADGTIKMYGVG